MTPIAAARFDDLTPGREHSFVLDDPVDSFVAYELGEVRQVIDAVEAASARGLWAAGFVAYEAAPAFDAALTVSSNPGESALPLAWFATYRSRRAIASPDRRLGPEPYRVAQWHPTTNEDHYRAAVATVRDRIAAGDTYQVNLTLRMATTIEGDLDALYEDLLLAQQGGYGACLHIGGHTILSASPEQFFRVAGGRIRVRPMKGTARRGRWSEEDKARSAALAADEKERAENLMIVDMLRNDCGRIAEFGSVEVTDMFTPERYGTVWQLTSTIEATLRPDTRLSAVFGALFPSGSVTGAPKASTMRIISELETDRRGVYCGAVGYVAPASVDEAHFNVAIRTVVVEEHTGRAEYGTGGGITWDSTAEGEYAEALLKTDLLTSRSPRFELLETMRWESGRYLMLERHLDRMAGSATYFGFPLDRAAVIAVLDGATPPADAPHRVRLLVDRTGRAELTWAERLDRPFVPGPEAAGFRTEPIRLAVSPAPIDPNDRMLFHKTTDRSRYDRALAGFPDADDVVLITPDGYISETATANLAVLVDGEWRTPSLEQGCLPGVLRARELESGALVEHPIHLDELGLADQIAVLNSVRGWSPARLQSASGSSGVP